MPCHQNFLPKILQQLSVNCIKCCISGLQTPGGSQREMAKLLHLFTLQLLFGFFTLCILQKITTADLRSVHPGENVSLNCNITADDEEIFWFKHRSEELKLIYSNKSKADKIFKLSYNVTRSHFNVTQTNSSISLVIIGVKKTDLGLYYCGARKNQEPIQFRKTIRLSFTEERKNVSIPDCNRIINIILSCVCSVSILINIILCVYCCRERGNSESSFICCSNTTDSTEKEEDLHYASVKHKRSSRAAAERNTVSDLDCVTYATVTSQNRKH